MDNDSLSFWKESFGGATDSDARPGQLDSRGSSGVLWNLWPYRVYGFFGILQGSVGVQVSANSTKLPVWRGN